MVVHPLYISVRLTDNKNTNKKRLDLIYCLIKTDTELQLVFNKSVEALNSAVKKTHTQKPHAEIWRLETNYQTNYRQLHYNHDNST